MSVCFGRRSLVNRGLGLVCTSATLGACSAIDTVSGWMPWSSSRTKLPELSALLGANQLSAGWRVSIGPTGLGFVPVLATSQLLLANRAGQITAHDAQSGERLWTFQHRVGFSTGLAVGDQLLVLASRDGRVVAFDPRGNQVWSAVLGAEAVSVPALGEGLVVVRTSDSRIQAIDLDSGRPRWSIARQSPPLVLRATNTAVFRSGWVFLGLPGGRLIAVNALSGQVEWEALVSAPRGTTEIERLADVLGAPLVGDDDVVALSFQGKLSSFERTTGQLLWSREIGGAGGVAGDRQQLFAADDLGTVHAFSRSGAPQWRQEALRARGLGAPAVSARHVLLADDQGLLHALSREQGTLVGRLQLSSKDQACAPLVEDNRGWVLGVDGALTQFRIASA
jgi:outer membrane protein assembly factor BamB